jgi:hypothetical protein
MSITKCTLMREGVLVSALLLILGILFLSLAVWVLPDVLMLPIIANVMGIGSLLLAPIFLVAALVMAVWPGSTKYFADCNH